MQKSIETILVEYEKADLTRRLHIYLAHRDLRHRFIEIDRREIPLRHRAPNVSFKSAGTCRRVFRRLEFMLNSLVSIIGLREIFR